MLHILIICAILAGCGRQKGTVELEKAGQAEIAVSDMLAVDKALDESGAQKELVKQLGADRVHFGFDQYEVLPKDIEYLKKVVEYLNVNIDLKIEIQGNCDSRGLPAYNIALGERRANAILKYLKNNGIAADRITCVSFGSRVIIEGDSEEAYAKNRVGIIVIK